MASTKEYLAFVLGQLSGLDDISYKTMMGEYILYHKQKIFGGVYDDRFLVKPVKAAIIRMPNAVYELPYEGAKKMLPVDCLDDKDCLSELVRAMYEELPAPKTNRKK